eukprot:scaffold314_cov128-Skeletonema_dohrnii-CCMP3373.AAC.2
MRYGYLTNCTICRPTTLGVWTLVARRSNGFEKGLLRLMHSTTYLPEFCEPSQYCNRRLRHCARPGGKK